jgi:CHRD domain
MMSSRVALWVTGACLLTLTLVVPGQAEERSLRARLSGFEEVIAAGGAVFSTASGQFRARIARDEESIDYELSYEFPNPGPTEGTQYVNQAHLHFGQRHTTGGIIIFLCDSADTPSPAGAPDCPSPSGTVNGTLTAAGVIGPAGQGISAGDFAALIEALRAGTVYANVHSDVFPAGEIRGQVRPRDDD